MSDDLISRKAVIAFAKSCKEKETGAFTKGYNKALKDIIATINSNSFPTAYDVDKVIEQLEEKMFTAELYRHGWNGQTVCNLLCMGDVGEIVKAGGKEIV